jgi:peptidoglycan hydrolase-like protein with peptidoglycan-binding domain
MSQRDAEEFADRFNKDLAARLREALAAQQRQEQSDHYRTKAAVWDSLTNDHDMDPREAERMVDAAFAQIGGTEGNDFLQELAGEIASGNPISRDSAESLVELANEHEGPGTFSLPGTHATGVDQEPAREAVDARESQQPATTEPPAAEATVSSSADRSSASIGGMTSGAQEEMSATELQQFLVDQGYDLGEFGPNGDGVDGIIGGVTTAAIKEFQKDQGLQVDGIVGKNTLAAIQELQAQQVAEREQSQGQTAEAAVKEQQPEATPEIAQSDDGRAADAEPDVKQAAIDMADDEFALGQAQQRQEDRDIKNALERGEIGAGDALAALVMGQDAAANAAQAAAVQANTPSPLHEMQQEMNAIREVMNNAGVGGVQEADEGAERSSASVATSPGQRIDTGHSRI